MANENERHYPGSACRPVRLQQEKFILKLCIVFSSKAQERRQDSGSHENCGQSNHVARLSRDKMANKSVEKLQKYWRSMLTEHDKIGA